MAAARAELRFSSKFFILFSLVAAAEMMIFIKANRDGKRE